MCHFHGFIQKNVFKKATKRPLFFEKVRAIGEGPGWDNPIFEDYNRFVRLLFIHNIEYPQPFLVNSRISYT